MGLQALEDFWNWIDKRDIDKMIVSIFIMSGTYKLTEWAINFAMTSLRPGVEVAMIVGAVTAPYIALQTVSVKWYFDARSS